MHRVNRKDCIEVWLLSIGKKRHGSDTIRPHGGQQETENADLGSVVDRAAAATSYDSRHTHAFFLSLQIELLEHPSRHYINCLVIVLPMGSDLVVPTYCVVRYSSRMVTAKGAKAAAERRT